MCESAEMMRSGMVSPRLPARSTAEHTPGSPGPSAAGSRSPAFDARLLQHGGVDACLAPRGVGDPLARAVLGGDLHECSLQGGHVDAVTGEIGELALEVHALLDQVHPR